MSRVNLITGGAGFIGANLAHTLMKAGEQVILYDNLSRGNVERNVEWLHQQFPGKCTLLVADVRDQKLLRGAVRRADAVFHFAAQVAVTTSIEDPELDFSVNAGGTLNVLEAVRHCDTPPPLFFTSTNKVYGELPDLADMAAERARTPAETLPAVNEDRPLDLHSPYGCSKGAADQYIRDYARTFGLKTVVFRMSCIYGPRQFGTEDQGWVAHFLIRALRGEPLTIYGDGRQVRDLLFVSDLVEAFLAARHHIDRCAGQVFNMGGGRANAVDLLRVLNWATEAAGKRPLISYEAPRQGDQRYYVSDTSKFERTTGWRATTSAADGVRKLVRWLEDEAPASGRVSTGPRPWLEAAR